VDLLLNVMRRDLFALLNEIKEGLSAQIHTHLVQLMLRQFAPARRGKIREEEEEEEEEQEEEEEEEEEQEESGGGGVRRRSQEEEESGGGGDRKRKRNIQSPDRERSGSECDRGASSSST